MAEKEIYLIRHLATSMNKSGVYMGREYNPPILEEEVPSFLRRIDFLKEELNLESPIFYSSPALRCIQTLDLLKKELGLSSVPTKIEQRLQETDFGKASGLTAQQIKDQYPKVYESWVTDQSTTVFPGGESYQDVQERGFNALREITSNLDGISSIFVCTHVDAIKMILFRITNTPISSKPLIIVPNGAVCKLVLSKDVLKLKIE